MAIDWSGSPKPEGNGRWWPEGMTGHEVKEALRKGTLNLRPGAETGSLAAVIAGCTCASFARNDYRPGYVLIDKACRWHGDNIIGEEQ